jgi:hypothetical protein
MNQVNTLPSYLFEDSIQYYPQIRLGFSGGPVGICLFPQYVPTTTVTKVFFQQQQDISVYKLVTYTRYLPTHLPTYYLPTQPQEAYPFIISFLIC